MKTVIYRDHDGYSPRVEWQGIKFLDGQPVEVSDPHVLAKIRSNPHFEIVDARPKAASQPSAEPSEGADEGTEPAQQAPRRGRPPKAASDAENQD